MAHRYAIRMVWRKRLRYPLPLPRKIILQNLVPKTPLATILLQDAGSGGVGEKGDPTEGELFFPVEAEAEDKVFKKGGVKQTK